MNKEELVYSIIKDVSLTDLLIRFTALEKLMLDKNVFTKDEWDLYVNDSLKVVLEKVKQTHGDEVASTVADIFIKRQSNAN